MDELSFLRTIMDVLERREPEAVLAGALDAAVRLSGAQRGSLLVPAPDGGWRVRLARGAALDETVSRGVLDRLLITGTVRLDNALEEPAIGQRASVRTLGLLSVLAVPVLVETEVVAAIYLESRSAAGRFKPDAHRVLHAFPAKIGPAPPP